MMDFDPLDDEHVNAILKEHDVSVSLEAPIHVGSGEPMPPEAWESMREWHFGWKHGGLSLMMASRAEEEARAAAALFVVMWNAKMGMCPGTLRDIAVIYINRCYDVHRMTERVDAFLAEVERLDSPETVNGLFSKVYEIHKMQWDGKFDELNCILRDFDARKRSKSAAVAFLGYTSQAKDKLPSRKDLYEVAFAEEVKRSGEEAAKKIFNGLK